MTDIIRHLVGLTKALFKIAGPDFERKFRESLGA